MNVIQKWNNSRRQDNRRLLKLGCVCVILWPIFDSNWLRYARHIGAKKKHLDERKKKKPRRKNK